MPEPNKPSSYHVLSLKQPWAALLVAGIKTIEIRSWFTNYRGRLLIHAAQTPDKRPEAWSHVPPHLLDLTNQRGGIIGVGTLTACISYNTLNDFLRDQHLHLNDEKWFNQKELFGLKFEHLSITPFVKLIGNVRIFKVASEILYLSETNKIKN